MPRLGSGRDPGAARRLRDPWARGAEGRIAPDPAWKAVGRAGRLARLALAALWLAASSAGFVEPAVAAEDSPYWVAEFVVQRAPGQQYEPIISGNRVFWHDPTAQAARRIQGRDLSTGQYLSLDLEAAAWPMDVDGDTLVATEVNASGQYAIYAYHLPDGARTVVAPPRGDGTSSRTAARISGDVVVWGEGVGNAVDVFAYSLKTRQLTQLTAQPARREAPTVSGNVVVWLDYRNARPDAWEADVYGYDLAGRREFRVTGQPEPIGQPAISGNVVVWPSLRGDVGRVQGYDLASALPITIATLPSGAGMPSGVDVDGDLVVWSARGAGDEDVFGYDLRQRRTFVVSRAIGDQRGPRISGRTVVWSDGRNSGVAKYEGDTDVYGARLEPGPSAPPPVVGAPDSADARVEIVWPEGGAPVAEASRANVAAWLFLPGTLNLAPCQWNPRVQLWQSLNNEPARLVAAGWKTGSRYYTPDRRAIPNWEFNGVDVSAARDPRNRIYLFVTLDGVPSRTNVWAHAADARTYFPNQDVPAGVAASPDAVEARIEIVWPHDNAPVDQARLVNVTAALFRPGTLLSVPPDWSPRVRLYRSLNNGIGEPVALGEKRLVQGRGFAYPVWDFNDVDVSAARDPANKYYFTLDVEGVQTLTNVWTHGADARTYFPKMDVPTASCQ